MRELGLARVRRGRKVRTTMWTRLILGAPQMALCAGGRAPGVGAALDLRRVNIIHCAA
jgi:hypothetical protein